MNEFEERQKVREQRSKLLGDMQALREGTSILPSENGGEPEVGRNDGSEAGGTAPVGGEIDLQSARQQYKGLTGQAASAKWTAKEIAEKIGEYRLANAPAAPAGAEAGTGQGGPLTKEDEKKAEEELKDAAAERLEQDPALKDAEKGKK